LITVQNYHLRSVCTVLSDSETIYYLYDNFVISSYAVSKLHDLLQRVRLLPIIFTGRQCPSRAP